MKSAFALLFIIGLNLCAVAQEVAISGTIKGLADENMVVTFPPDWFGNSWKEDLVVSSGTFQKSCSIPASGRLQLHYKDKDRTLYLWKNATKLDLQFDADFLDGEIQLNGDAAAIDGFMQIVDEKFASRFSLKWLEEQSKDATNIDAMEMDAFSTRNDVIHLLETFQTALPDEFKKSFNNHAAYFYYLSLFKFSEAKTRSSAIPKASEIPKVLIEGLTWERMNRADELDSEYFRELLVSFVAYKALENYDFMKFPDRAAAVQEAYNVARAELRGLPLQFYLTSVMLNEASNVQPSLLRQMRDFLATTENSNVYVQLVVDSLGERLVSKDDEPVVVLKGDVDHTEIDVEVMGEDGSSFKLSDLKGKVVYLDIWASWCGPCRQQFPAAKALKEQLSKKEMKNIEFLYISIDNTETVWKKAIEELGIEGKHGLSKGGWGSEVTAKFGVSSIPRYLIFDKKGKVVDPNAPRPSDPRLIDILRKLAEQ
ncbi:MAG: hypothetical protein RL266_1748 [Bacteroidota bacterium]|jgi:thiol-disulfide isomerase/thioredoxin